MNTTIYVPDIECDSCSKVLTRTFEKTQGITAYTISPDSVNITFNESEIKEQDIISLIKSKGFRASTQEFERKTLKERKKDFKENKHKYKLERKVITYSIGLFFLLFIIEALTYAVFLKNIPNFITNYGWWLLYLNISMATLTAAIWHVLAYKAKITCMTGMMIGMTIGMQSGMMLGAVMGATNGFFVGAMVGMILSTIVGAITGGKCCGVMGVMEGMMAGLMGGTMGPMITVMMFSDNVLWFMPFYIIINVGILWGLSYMMYEEVVEGKLNVIKRPLDFTSLAAYTTIITVILLGIMFFGPKTSLIAF